MSTARTLVVGVLLRHPATGAATYLAPGSELPTWAEDQVGDHALDGPATTERRRSDRDVEPASSAALTPSVAEPGARSSHDGPPPKSGPGSSDARWTAYARAHGVVVTDEMRRREVIAACQAAGVATEGSGGAGRL